MEKATTTVKNVLSVTISASVSDGIANTDSADFVNTAIPFVPSTKRIPVPVCKNHLTYATAVPFFEDAL